jgi:hypothetical protein
MRTWLTRRMLFFLGCSIFLLVPLASLAPPVLYADTVKVHYIEGVTHGFLLLRSEAGEILADGDLRQVVGSGGRVVNQITFRFKDGSLYDETTIFTQRGEFRVVSDKVVSKGPSFKHPGETFVDVTTGQVTLRSEENGKEKTVTEHMKLPPDLANGMVFTLLKNISPDTPQTTLSMVAGTTKPRLVKLVISTQDGGTSSLGKIHYKAVHYVVKVQIGGVAGVVAPLVGKQPPDVHIWILKDGAPVFIAFEGPLVEDSPVWRIEFAAPVLSKE